MSIIAVLLELEKLGVGGDIVSLFKTLEAYFQQNNGTVNPADIAILQAYGAKTSASYLAAAQAGAVQAAPASTST